MRMHSVAIQYLEARLINEALHLESILVIQLVNSLTEDRLTPLLNSNSQQPQLINTVGGQPRCTNSFKPPRLIYNPH